MATINIRPGTQLPGSITFEDLQAKVAEYLLPEKQEMVAAAYAFAEQSHAGQYRKSGEPYVIHPLNAAYSVADLLMDASTVCGALLHDVVEDCGVSLEELERRFGPEVARLVDGVTKVSRIDWAAAGVLDDRRRDRGAVSAESLRKMMLAMAEDVRVVIIKLADRLHNMRTLQALPPERRKAIAKETMEIFAPLATRLGIWQFKWELEDLAFQHMEPDRFKEIARFVAANRTARQAYISDVRQELENELGRIGLKADVSGRPKHLFSVYEKKLKYAEQGKDISQIYDILALRVLVESIQDCYAVLGVVHNLWRPLPGTFDDYISNSKESGYQSLHTTVIAKGDHPLEVQIRTNDMHHVAEYGVAAHWRYKGGSSKDVKLEERLTWLRQLLEWQRELHGAEEFVESVKTDLINDRVFVYTPKGEIKDLPATATPLDFAYRIHTDLGHRCVGSKVNGRLVPLSYHLKTGDVVEIMAGKGERAPRLDWLNPNLGYLNTTHGREKVRQWFRRRDKTEAIERAHDLIKRELGRLGLTMSDQEIARLFKFDNVEEFMAAVGYGDVNIGAIGVKLAAQQERPVPSLPQQTPSSPASPTEVKGLKVMGVGDLLTRLASCCHPVPGDAITGYVTRTRGITVHRTNCPNVVHEDETERLIPVEWGPGSQLSAVPVKITAIDRVGLLRDIASLVSAEKINILQTYQAAQADGTAQFLLTLETTGMSQLNRMLAKIEGLGGVTAAVRMLDSGTVDNLPTTNNS